MTNVVEKAAELRLFPTSVWVAQLSKSFFEPVNKNICSLLDDIKSGNPDLAEVGQWQTGQDLHRSQELTPLVDLINTQTTGICQSLTLEYDRFEITGCWGNISQPGLDRRAHYHPNNFLSGVHYVRVSDGADTIEFHDPRPQAGLIVPPARDQNLANPDKFSLQVCEGTLAIFPAWLIHSVPANQSDGIRISIAFNIMFPDFGSRMANSMWQANTK